MAWEGKSQLDSEANPTGNTRYNCDRLLLAVHAVFVSIVRKLRISLIRLRANLDFQLLLAVHQVFRHRRTLSGSRNGFSYLVVYSNRLTCPPSPLLTRISIQAAHPFISLGNADKNRRALGS